jgi:uncharacterized membrane protein YbhN (UPF0104 family)
VDPVSGLIDLRQRIVPDRESAAAGETHPAADGRTALDPRVRLRRTERGMCPVTSNAAASAGHDPSASAAAPGRRAAILRLGVLVGILLLVFGVVLPRVVDYEDVVSAFRALTPAQLGLMIGLAAIGYVTSGLLFVAVLPGLSVLRGAASYLMLSGLGSSVPLLPWNLGVVWLVLREWGLANPTAVSGLALYAATSWLARIALPPVALVVMALGGNLGGPGNRAFTVALLSGLVFIVMAVLGVALVRSKSLADWLGRTADRIVSWVLRRLGRPSTSPGIGAALERFRSQLVGVIQRRGLVGLGAGVLAQIWWCAVLVVALLVTGVPSGAIAPAEVFAVYSLVSVLTLILVAPGGAGFTEVLLIAGLTTIAGTRHEAEITAGVFLYRLFEWFLPIPLAWILLKLVRRGQPIIPTATELRAIASGEST